MSICLKHISTELLSVPSPLQCHFHPISMLQSSQNDKKNYHHMALVPLQQVMRMAPPYHDKLFPQSGADHKSSVILFSTRVQSQDFFRMVTSHIWHRYIFWGCCVWLEAFLARFRHVSSVSHYVSTLTISQDYFLLYVWAPLQGPGYI